MAGITRALRGIPDGVTKVFETDVDYAPGSVRVFINGVLQVKTGPNGWDELGKRFIRMKVAPVVGADLQAYFEV